MNSIVIEIHFPKHSIIMKLIAKCNLWQSLPFYSKVVHMDIFFPKGKFEIKLYDLFIHSYVQYYRMYLSIEMSTHSSLSLSYSESSWDKMT